MAWAIEGTFIFNQSLCCRKFLSMEQNLPRNKIPWATQFSEVRSRDMITVDETFFKVGAAVVSIFLVYRILLFGISLSTRADPKAGNEDPAEAELSWLKSKSSSISSLAIWVGLEDEIWLYVFPFPQITVVRRLIQVGLIMRFLSIRYKWIINIAKKNRGLCFWWASQTNFRHSYFVRAL